MNTYLFSFGNYPRYSDFTKQKEKNYKTGRMDRIRIKFVRSTLGSNSRKRILSLGP